ncbi:MAG: CPBP family glutamic-type intramembrane protease [Eubacteriaceae bacterium]
MKSTTKTYCFVGIVYLIGILSLVFLAVPLQRNFGMVGLVLTEILILFIAIVAGLMSKKEMKEIFPFKVPRISQIFGTLILWLGTYILVLLISTLSIYLFPSMIELSTGLGDFISSVPMKFAIIIVAFLPAVCEEALFRGFFLSNLDAVKNSWKRIVIVGILFGGFHLDPYRFLPTAVLGIVLSYILVKTENLWLPMLFHLVNNLVSTLATFSSVGNESDVVLETNSNLFLIAAVGMCFYCIIVPWAFLLGRKLIGDVEKKEREEEKKDEKRRVHPAIAAGIGSAFFIVLGIVLGSFCDFSQFIA